MNEHPSEKGIEMYRNHQRCVYGTLGVWFARRMVRVCTFCHIYARES